MITCETVTVTVTHPHEGSVSLVMPAFTRPSAELEREVVLHLRSYLSKSRQWTEPVSLADFVLYLMQRAAEEPTTIEQ